MRRSIRRLTGISPFLVGFLFASQAMGEKGADFPVPVYPKATHVVSKSGSGKGTKWYQVSFATRDPYERVVKFYREKAGAKAVASQSVSEKIQGTLILISETTTDQTQINISHEAGSKRTKVVILRQLLE